MKLRELIKRVDKSDKNKTSIDPTELAELFGYYDMLSIDSYEEFDKRMIGYWIHVTIDTDTWVGIEACFLDGEFVMLRTQTARKSDENYEFKDVESKNKVKNFIFSYIDEEDNFQYIENLDEEMNEGIQAMYSSELLTDKLIDENGNSYTIVEKYPRDKDFEKIKIAKVVDSKGNESIKKLEDLLIPYRIK